MTILYYNPYSGNRLMMILANLAGWMAITSGCLFHFTGMLYRRASLIRRRLRQLWSNAALWWRNV